MFVPFQICNFNKPCFGPTVYQTKVLETLPLGTTITMVTAVDEDRRVSVGLL